MHPRSNLRVLKFYQMTETRGWLRVDRDPSTFTIGIQDLPVTIRINFTIGHEGTSVERVTGR